MARTFDTMSARIAELNLDPLRFQAQMRATREFMQDFPGTQVSFEQHIVHALDSEVYNMQLELQAHKGKPIVITFPRDWWEAVKLRFAPQWFVTRYPVQYLTHTIYPWAILPDLKVPRGQRVLRWAEHVAPSFTRWHTEDN